MCYSECLLLYTYIVSVGDRCDAGCTFEYEDDEHEDQVLLSNVSQSFLDTFFKHMLFNQKTMIISFAIEKHTNSTSDRFLFRAA